MTASEDRLKREQDLIAYYTNEVGARTDRALAETRVDRRTAYLRQLGQELRTSVLEIGCGPGRDGEAFATEGLTYTGIDLSPASVEACRALGLDAQVASVLDLPFGDATFDAGWTMSTLLHIADEDLAQALAEIVRVLRPGAPLAIGVWGAMTSKEEVWQDDTGFGPGRFFSIRSDEAFREALERHGALEEWLTWDTDRAMHYQWAILRTAGGLSR